jgi:hypothetical protein
MQNMAYFQVELVKPALFSMPEDVDTIAVFKRDFYLSDTVTFNYWGSIQNKPKIDTILKYSELSLKCVDALVGSLEEKGYFLKVINYRDSLNYLFTPGDTLFNYQEFHRKTGADAHIFLDYFSLKDKLIENTSSNYVYALSYPFPEFRKSTKLEIVKATLLWCVSFRADSSVYQVKQQPDDLIYGNSVYPDFFGSKENHRKLIENTAIYLGKNFCTKIIPEWTTVERSYYRSKNANMLQAEQLCLNGEWLKAAEIYQRETTNKNRNIAAKAKYNMALICEMEGKPDVAIDWLINSHSTFKYPNEEHQFNCRLYINTLAARKKEIERLDKQVRER